MVNQDFEMRSQNYKIKKIIFECTTQGLQYHLFKRKMKAGPKIRPVI